MLDVPIPHARCLDMSGLRETDWGLYVYGNEGLTLDDVFFGRVSDAPFFDNLERVCLGSWHTDARAAAFEGRGIQVMDREG